MENFKHEIFEHLGTLFYALAADQHISPMQSGELKMLLRKDWLTDIAHRSEDKISEAAHIMGLTLDSLQNEKVPAETAYGIFERFYSVHSEQFSQALNQKILDTAEAILKIFPDRGEKNAHLEDLRILLRQPQKSSQESRQ